MRLGPFCCFHSHWIHTMTRCVVALLLTLAAALPAHAQRTFERNALRGELVIVAPPEARLNGQSVRLAPGARVRSQQNLLLLSGSLLEQKLLVHYTLDGMGQVQDVWILSAAEAARQPWPKTPAEAQAWIFDPTLQRWSKP
jgi:hypothetical protein